MSPLDINLGVDVTVTDEPAPAAAPTATDTGFLIQPLVDAGSPTGLSEIRSAGEAKALFPNEPDLLTLTDGFFLTGGARLWLSSLETDAATAAAEFQPQHGPGQVFAPTLVTDVAQEPLKDWAWDHNRIFIADGPDGATQANLETLAAALIDDTAGRFAMLEADTILIPGDAPGTTRDCPSSAIVAGLIARSDINTGNPNLAAAGNHTPGAAGQVNWAVGIKNERSATEQQALARAQVNCFRTVNNRVRNYGFWTLADLDALPQWWDVSGSRTIMALRAREQAVAEEMMFSQVDATGLFLDRYQGALAGVCSELQRQGAIYGTAQDPGYNVDVTSAVNPIAQVAQGLVTAHIVVRTSPFAAELDITITRRAITQPAVA